MLNDAVPLTHHLVGSYCGETHPAQSHIPRNRFVQRVGMANDGPAGARRPREASSVSRRAAHPGAPRLFLQASSPSVVGRPRPLG